MLCYHLDLRVMSSSYYTIIWNRVAKRQGLSIYIYSLMFVMTTYVCICYYQHYPHQHFGNMLENIAHILTIYINNE